MEDRVGSRLLTLKSSDMKRLGFIVLVFLASCQKQTPDSDIVRIDAGFSHQSTRVSLSDDVLYWTPTDTLSLAGMESGRGAVFTNSLESASLSATFTGSGPRKYANGVYYAVCPYSAVRQWSSSDNGVVAAATIPVSQTARPGQIPVGAAVLAAVSGTDGAMMFSHQTGYIRFTVSGKSTPFVSVKIVPNTEKYMTGGVKMTFSDSQISFSQDSSVDRFRYVSLSSEDGKPLGEGVYYAAVIPAGYNTGFTFTFFDGKGGEASVSTALEKYTILPGSYLDVGGIGTLEMKNPADIVGTKYISGTDKGVFWKYDAATGEAYAVSAWRSEGTMKWSDPEEALLGATNDADGRKNVEAIHAFADYPKHVWAADECEKSANGFQAGGWYLPARDEICALYDAYYGLEAGSMRSWAATKHDLESLSLVDKERKALFDKSMGEVGGYMMDAVSGGTEMWSSTTTKSLSNVYMIRFGSISYINHKSKGESHYVRCIKRVKI